MVLSSSAVSVIVNSTLSVKTASVVKVTFTVSDVAAVALLLYETDIPVVAPLTEVLNFFFVEP